MKKYQHQYLIYKNNPNSLVTIIFEMIRIESIEIHEFPERGCNNNRHEVLEIYGDGERVEPHELVVDKEDLPIGDYFCRGIGDGDEWDGNEFIWNKITVEKNIKLGHIKEIT